MKKVILSMMSCLLVLIGLAGGATAGQAAGAEYEVWLADQGTNKIHIYDQNHTEIDTIDFAEVGKKPHMIVFDEAGDYAYTANMGSGTVSVIRAADREVLATLETDNGAHAAIPSPDGTMVLVANTPGQSISKILVDKENEEFSVEQTIDLTQVEALKDDNEFPNRSPICLQYTEDSKKAFVTVGGGGLFVLDTETLEIVQAFGKSVVGAHGCGLVLSPDGKEMYANSGSGTDGFYYIFDTATNQLIHKASTEGLDAHGVAITVDEKQLLIANRQSDDITIMDIATKKIVDRIDFVGNAPDLIKVSPDGKYAYVSLRGPEPATGTHNMAGDTPGVAIVNLETKSLQDIISIETEGADPHGIELRVLKAPEKVNGHKEATVKEGSKEVVVGDKKIALPVEAKNIQGELWISVRSVVEALGGSVFWNNAEKSFVIEVNNELVRFQIGSDQVVANGKAYELSANLYIDRGHSQVPAALLLELLGYELNE